MGLVQHYFLPLVTIIGLPLATLFLANNPRDEDFTISMLFGNLFSWTVVIAWAMWCAAFLYLPFDHYKGPPTPTGDHPEYSNNYEQLYRVTIGSYLFIHIFWPDLSNDIYANFPQIVATTNILGLLLCGWLWWRATHRPKCSDDAKQVSFLYDFCYGIERHPRVWNIDIKELIVARIGMTSWSLIIIAFTLSSYLKEGFNMGLFINFLLQQYYLKKFSSWEAGYLTTPDITDSRAGFLTCWTAMNWIPVLHVYTTYYFTNHLPDIDYVESAGILAFGLVVITVKFQIDMQKDIFKEANGNCIIKGKQPVFIEAEYQTAQGTKKNKLLASGFWGLARHLNYTFEILSVLSWSLVGYRTNSFQPFLYLFYLIILLVYRCYKDDTKCSNKYGEYWKRYCEIAKYKMIPYVF